MSSEPSQDNRGLRHDITVNFGEQDDTSTKPTPTIGNSLGEKLDRLEGEAFSLVRKKQSNKAWELLNGEDYRRYKSEYSDGLAKFSQRLKEHSESMLQAAYGEDRHGSN